MNPPSRDKAGQTKNTIVLHSEHQTESGELKTSTHAPIDRQTKPDHGEVLFTAPVALSRREGSKVYLRSLRPGEEDTGEGVRIAPGETVLFETGDLSITSRHVDTFVRARGPDGYAAVANTIWTWYPGINLDGAGPRGGRRARRLPPWRRAGG